MEEALRAAQRALDIGEVPVGAIVVHENRIIARAWNQNIALNDPTAHAEIVHARLQRLVYGAADPKAGAVYSVMRVLNHRQLNHKMQVQGGVLAGRCAELLQTFFRNKRKEGVST